MRRPGAALARIAAAAALSAALGCSTSGTLDDGAASPALVSGEAPPPCTDPHSTEAQFFAELECIRELVNSGIYVRRSHYCIVPSRGYCRQPAPGRSGSRCSCEQGRLSGRFQ